MGIRSGVAAFIGSSATFVLRKVFHRAAANFPGKAALYADPRIIEHTAGKLTRGSICVVGTNGKTTVNNMIADCLEAAGMTTVCNRTGANLDSGIATSLLQARRAQWGVFESDELWLAKSLPQLQSDYVLLLNLFRDQLDRVGEIDRIQDSIAGALASSPQTVLVYNADDPLCERIARSVANPTVPFGIGEDLGLPQNTVSDARMCQSCDHMLSYGYRQYGQLGDFFCTECGFSRAPLAFSARNCRVGDAGLSFDVVCTGAGAAQGSRAGVQCSGAVAPGPDRAAACKSGVVASIEAPYTGVYMIYNLLAVFCAAHLMGAGNEAIARAMAAFDPRNGRLQTMSIRGREVLLNLAKNPTGFNQNLKLVSQARGRKAAAFFINDKEADGHDISWIWDVDFEELAGQPDVVVFAGGIRRNDLQVRLKYAGVRADLVDGPEDVMERVAQLPADYKAYLIANYTSLPAVREGLMKMEADGAAAPALPDDASAAEALAVRLSAKVPCEAPDAGLIDARRPLRIVHLFPDLLNLYGDGGNIKVLRRRCARRGIPVEVEQVDYGQTCDLSRADIVFLGGGPDREQKLANDELLRMRDALAAYVEDGGVLLAICGGYQILGPSWLMGDAEVEGLGILDIETRRAGTGFNRLIDNIVISSPVAARKVVGYENHAGRTYLGRGLEPFGRVVGSIGKGNNDDDGADGVLYRSLIATYLHGPLLAKNPEVADWIIARAVERRTGTAVSLPALDDAEELAANAYMCKRLGAE